MKIVIVRTDWGHGGLTVLANARAGNISESATFTDKIFDFLDRTEYRRVRTQEDLNEIGRFRFRAFDAKPVYTEKFDGVILDSVDNDPYAMTFGIYIDEKLASSVRLHVLTPEHRVSPALDMFPSHLEPLLDQGVTFIDPSRFTVDLTQTGEIVGLPHITLRLAVMATRYFRADFCLSCVKKEHAPFYRRTFRATAVAGPHRFPGMGVDAVLFASSRSSFDDIIARYPLYNYLPREAELLFGTPADGVPAPLTVLPTARLALQQQKLAAA